MGVSNFSSILARVWMLTAVISLVLLCGRGPAPGGRGGVAGFRHALASSFAKQGLDASDPHFRHGRHLCSFFIVVGSFCVARMRASEDGSYRVSALLFVYTSISYWLTSADFATFE